MSDDNWIDYSHLDQNAHFAPARPVQPQRTSRPFVTGLVRALNGKLKDQGYNVRVYHELHGEPLRHWFYLTEFEGGLKLRSFKGGMTTREAAVWLDGFIEGLDLGLLDMVEADDSPYY